MLPARFNHLEHLEALRGQPVALLAQQRCFIEIIHD
jgi:hypothetical protein